MKTNREIVIIGGGTFNHIRNHFSMAAPAFGNTAKKLYDNLNIHNVKLFLTKMADSSSSIVTNEDLSNLIDSLIDNKNVGTIILNAAICDFEVPVLNGIKSGEDSPRLFTKDGLVNLVAVPSDKIISRIRKKRPDIFLVGFKTT